MNMQINSNRITIFSSSGGSFQMLCIWKKNEALYIQQRIFPYSRGLFSTVSLTLETERTREVEDGRQLQKSLSISGLP